MISGHHKKCGLIQKSGKPKAKLLTSNSLDLKLEKKSLETINALSPFISRISQVSVDYIKVLDVNRKQTWVRNEKHENFE